MSHYASLIQGHFGPKAIADARAHALREFPNESCGLIVGREYVPCFNYALDPSNDFIISDADYDRAGDQLRAVVHSHPMGPLFPSERDMVAQFSAAVPYVIVTVDVDEAYAPADGEIIAFGDGLPIAEVIGRPFIHGVFDCYELVRDTFRLGKDKLAEQGVAWHLPPHDILPPVPREDNWWASGADLYMDYLEKTGWYQISPSEVRAGDCILMDLSVRRTDNPHSRLNHAGVVVPGDRILHHIAGRVSRRDPLGMWKRVAGLCIRHEVNEQRTEQQPGDATFAGAAA